MSQPSMLDPNPVAMPSGDLEERARQFCNLAPYRNDPFARRNWGGVLHSLCSYQGKLKPSIAKFLIEWFTQPGDRVLDPMAGVGTIPLEARRQGRVGIGNDLSPLAASVTRAKVEPFESSQVADLVADLEKRIVNGPALSELTRVVDVEFGLNGPIRGYFHEETLREVLIARQAFTEELDASPAKDVVFSSLLHILHGNRPYALSRRSHPVTPFAPSGPFEYRSVIERLETRLARVIPELEDLASSSLDGEAYEADCRAVPIRHPVDAVITSPPFAKSLRFWSSNWLRLWFTGWDRKDFEAEPQRYLDVQQRAGMGPYGELAAAMHAVLRPGGIFILHLGETAKVNMADAIRPEIEPWFEIEYAGRENVEDTETHGLRDKGATVAHWYLFARRRA